MESHTIRDVKLLLQGNTAITRVLLKIIARPPAAAHPSYRPQANSKKHYKIMFTFTSQNKYIDSTLTTTRNQPYRLADLNRGIKFIRKLFPSVRTIEIEIK